MGSNPIWGRIFSEYPFDAKIVSCSTSTKDALGGWMVASTIRLNNDNNNNSNDSFVHLPLMVNLPRNVSIFMVFIAGYISLGYVVCTEISS